MKKVHLIGMLLGAIALSSCDIYSLIGYLDSKDRNNSNIESSISYSASSNGYYQSEDYLDAKFSYQEIGYCQGMALMPSKGDVKTLVVPVEFSDYKFDKTTLDEISIAFNGTPDETNYWESVHTYYQKSSYGLLNLSFDVAPVFSLGVSTFDCLKKYDNSDDYIYFTDEVMASYYKSAKNTVDFTQYDSDGDGYIDGIIFVYSAPNYNDRFINRIDFNGDLFWAFTTWFYDSNISSSKTKPIPSTYMWASYDFMHFYTSDAVIDAHTYIHETGHMLGLDDYYADNSPAGGFSMMDYNILDLDPFSKIALGWSKPFIVEDSCQIAIKPMESSGECIIIPPTNNQGSAWKNTCFDEYLIVELYTPTGLNELDSQYTFESLKGPSIAGVRLWHVDARIVRQNIKNNSIINYVDEPNINDYSNWYFVGASNTYKNDGIDERFDLLSIIKASKESITSGIAGDVLSLFRTGSVFEMSAYSKYFANKTTLNNGKKFNFSITFNSVSRNGAIVSFVRK